MRLLALAAPLALLTACATADTKDVASAENEFESASPYGLFLAGEAALNDGRSSDATLFFDRAHAQTGDQPVLSERAFTAALLAGDIPKAAELAPRGEAASEASIRLGRLVVAVDAMAQGKSGIAKPLLAGDNIGFPHRAAAALLAPWAAAQDGDMETALVRPEVRGEPLVEYFGQLGQAYLFERARRYDEAETDFKAVTGGDDPADMMVLAYGGFLERRGRRPDAIALYDQTLTRDPDAQAVAAARRRAASGRAAPAAPTLKEGAAQALLAPAASMINEKQQQLALAYLRLVLRLDPQRSEAWLMVGDLLEDAGEMDAARTAFGRTKPGSVDYGVAQGKLAWTYQTAGDPETALKMARESAAGGDPGARLTLADLLRVNDKQDEAVVLLTSLIDERKRPDWRLHYARGAAYQKLSRWPEAEADLQTALKLRPDDPELLNYLGYLWIDRGEHLPQAMEMVKKAVASNPRSGAMVDSLGWAYYRLGDYRLAVTFLEQAVELEAGDPEINNHLGDAYWRVGRQDEARFQWRRVLTLDPEPAIKADADAKLASGLGPTGPAAAPKIAGQ